MSKPRIVGELVIVAYKARHLPEREIVGKQDPFVIFRLGETTKKTKTDLRGGQHPTWDDQVNLPVPEKKTLVVVQVYDEDAKRQELISECELDISKVLVEGEADDWYQLHYKGRPAGEIYLELTFYAAQPPPKRQPTRYGGRHPKPNNSGYAPLPPSVQQTPQFSNPYTPSPQYHSFGRPAPTPIESHSTPTYQASPYPPQQQQQQQRPPFNASPYPPQQQQAPFNMGASPYPPPNPTPSMSTGSSQIYPPHPNSRPNSYVPPPNSRPTSPPGNGSYGSNNSASLLSSSYNPSTAGRPNSFNGGGGGGGGYPPSNNRNSFPNYPPQHTQHGFNVGGFPEPQSYPSSGYMSHADPLGTPYAAAAAAAATPFASHQGTPFAAHQGTFHNGMPHHNGGYPPNYPPSQGYPPPPGGYN